MDEIRHPDPKKQNIIDKTINAGQDHVFRWWESIGEEEKDALRGADLDTFYFGDPNTDGSWRLSFDGTDLLVQVRVSGSWQTEAQFTP